MTRPDHLARVRREEVPGHRHERPVGQYETGPRPKFLDEAEDVVPPPAVQAGRVLAQLPEDLVHLEGGQDRFDQDRRADRAGRDAQLFLGGAEDVVPQPGFGVALHLRQVEVGGRPACEQPPGVVEEEEAEVEEAGGRRLPVHEQVLLFEVPSAGPHHEGRHALVQAVDLPGLGRHELDRALDGVGQVALALDEVPPRRRAGVLEVRHEDAGAGVQGVDHHLPVDRAGDLDAPVRQVGRNRRDGPLAGAHAGSFGKKIRRPAVVEPALQLPAARQELPPAPAEPPLEICDEGESRASQNGRALSNERSANLDAVGKCLPFTSGARRCRHLNRFHALQDIMPRHGQSITIVETMS